MGSKRKIIASLLIFCMVLLGGVVGFKFFGGPDWSWIDSLYMTVITLSTVGYEEPVDLNTNPAARVFASVFIILCLGTIAFAISSITSFVVEGELKNILWRKKMEKQLARLKNHYIICGSDATAHTIVSELLLTKREFVLVEPIKEKLEKLSTLGEPLFIHGDPMEDTTLVSAGIERAKGILLSLPTDEENLFVTLTARGLNPKIRIVTKGIDIKNHQKMEKAGADAVISPSFIGGMRMISEMVRPAVVSFLDMMLRDTDRILRFEEIVIKKESSLQGKSIREVKSSNTTEALLVSVKDGSTGEYRFNPPDDLRIQENDVLIFVGGPEMIETLKKSFAS